MLVFFVARLNARLHARATLQSFEPSDLGCVCWVPLSKPLRPSLSEALFEALVEVVEAPLGFSLFVAQAGALVETSLEAPVGSFPVSVFVRLETFREASVETFPEAHQEALFQGFGHDFSKLFFKLIVEDLCRSLLVASSKPLSRFAEALSRSLLVLALVDDIVPALFPAMHDLLGLLQTLVLDPVQLFLHQRVLPDLLLLLLELALFVSPLVLQPRRWAAAWVAWLKVSFALGCLSHNGYGCLAAVVLPLSLSCAVVVVCKSFVKRMFSVMTCTSSLCLATYLKPPNSQVPC